MSDQNLMDDPLVSFDSPVTNETKMKSFDDPFGLENGHDLFPVDQIENPKVHSTGENHGSATDHDNLLFDLDPNAPSTANHIHEPMYQNDNLLDMNDAPEPTVDFTSFTNPAYQMKSASDPVDQVAEDLVEKVVLTSSPATPTVETAEPFATANAPADEPTKKPTNAGTSKPSTVPKTKATSTKPTVTTSKSTEVKPALASRKTIHSAPVKAKPTATPTSPTQDASKPTPRDILTKPKPTATAAASAAPSRPTVKTSIKPTRPSTATKTTTATTPSSPDQATTVLSTAPAEVTSPSASAAGPTASKTRTSKPVTKPTPPTRVSTTKPTTSSSSTAAAAPTTVKTRPTSQTRASVRPATATSASATALPKRSNSAQRPATAEPSGRAARSSATEASASAGGTTVQHAKPNLNAVTSKIGSLQNATYRAGGGAVKRVTFQRPKSLITSQKLHWNAKSKIGSLENAHYKPGGGAVKIETKKLDFKEKAKAKTNSGIHDAATTNGDGNTSATASNEETHAHQDDILESPATDGATK